MKFNRRAFLAAVAGAPLAAKAVPSKPPVPDIYALGMRLMNHAARKWGAVPSNAVWVITMGVRREIFDQSITVAWKPIGGTPSACAHTFPMLPKSSDKYGNIIDPNEYEMEFCGRRAIVVPLRGKEGIVLTERNGRVLAFEEWRSAEDYPRCPDCGSVWKDGADRLCAPCQFRRVAQRNEAAFDRYLCECFHREAK